MGLTYSGVHAATEDREAVVAVLTETLASGGYRRREDQPPPPGAPVNRFLVSLPLNGWTTVLPSNDLDSREYAWAETISNLGCAALWLYLYDSSLLMYRLYRGGHLLDRYHSAGGDQVAVGNPRAFRPFLVAGATIEDLDRVLHPEPEEAPALEQRYLALARLLGIQTAATSYALAERDPLLLPGGRQTWTLVEFWYAGSPSPGLPSSASADE
ncbi:MAG: hypothetical protein RMM58_10690 [Chloroflexota bacterium]|nr:hypothetical protein [Dehalococcoidia bacterium]MDW8254332.1 hypothetical protein [Chloroflexota bacterium]